MNMPLRNYRSFITLIFVVLTASGGCGVRDEDVRRDDANSPKSEATADAGHNLEGWWCSEHGVPEEECSMCSTDAAAKLKAKGDWCEEHDRADSQCFIHHPELEAKFAARYEAKFGKKPPKPTE